MSKVGTKSIVEMMNSDDYKDRFKAEYFQLCERVEKLNKTIEKHKEGTLEFELSCPVEMLENQLHHMKEYQCILEERSFMEGINLFVIDLENREVMDDMR